MIVLNCLLHWMETLHLCGAEENFEHIHTYLSTIGAVLLGAGLAYWYTRRLERRKAELATILEFSNDLKKIECLCERYWLADHSDETKKEELKAIGYQLRAALMATAEYRELIEKLLGPKFAAFDSLDTRLSMLATGGNFQTSSMKASPETYQEIASLILKTELILRSIRNGF